MRTQTDKTGTGTIRTLRGLAVAAPASGSGKTTFTLGLLAALRKRGLRVAPFKTGPDFIDPGHHERITGHTSRNLDGWMLNRKENRAIFARSAAGADIAVVEGVMGLFDGFDGKSDAGSTAQMARWLGLPVLLVVDAGSMAKSFAAVVHGFAGFDPACRIFGAVANNVAGERHLFLLAQAMENADVLFLGGIIRNSAVEIPSRHLGLVTSGEWRLSDDMIDALAALVENSIDVDALLDRLPEIAPDIMPDSMPEKAAPPAHKPARTGPGLRIGVARDSAFCFYYEDNLDVLRENGCEIVYFSPLSGACPPPDINGLYLGGGYPELYAGRLAGNRKMRESIRGLCEGGMPVYAECGGFMYLCRRLATSSNEQYEMAGVFPFDACMQNRLTALGYREIRFTEDTPLAKAGWTVRGHEFHYSRLSENENPPPDIRQVYEAADKAELRRHCPGWLFRRTLGSYAHLHFRSRPGIGACFAQTMRDYKSKKDGKSHAAQ